MSQPEVRLVGAHVSAAGGVHNAMHKTAEIGGNTAQVFSGSPRVWQRPALDQIDTDKLFSEQEKWGVKAIFTHGLYLVNLASDKLESQRRSVEVLEHELRFDSLVKGLGVVVHVGSHQGRGWESVKEQLVELIAEIVTATPADSRFLIENSAGQKGKVCSDLKEVRWLLDQLEAKLGKEQVETRLGWCLDTCHTFSAGYSLSGGAEKEIEELDLWSSLKLIHVNDSRNDANSGKDQHANIGDGKIPTKDLQHFLMLPKLVHVPLVLEVPGLDGEGPDAANIARLKALVGSK